MRRRTPAPVVEDDPDVSEVDAVDRLQHVPQPNDVLLVHHPHQAHLAQRSLCIGHRVEAPAHALDGHLSPILVVRRLVHGPVRAIPNFPKVDVPRPDHHRVV